MATLSAAKIKPGTTPLLTVIVDNEDITEATVYVTIDAKDRQLVKSTKSNRGDIMLAPAYDGETFIGTQVSVQYSQAETLCLRPGYASVEIGWVDSEGVADKSDLARLKIPKALYRGVMAHG